MTFATNADTNLYWRLDGDPTTPRLLLLNSVGTNVEVWSRLVPLLMPAFHILRMDARGHGRSDAFNTDFLAMITRIAWQEIWGRPGLDHRTRRLLVVAITASFGRWEEFELRVKSGVEQNGFTEDELKETLMQTAIYAGVPAANTAFAKAATIPDRLREEPNA